MRQDCTTRRHDRYRRAAARSFAGGLAWLLLLSGPREAPAQLNSNFKSNTTDALNVKAEWMTISSVQGGYCPVWVELTSSGGPRQLRVAIRNQFNVGSEVGQYVALEANKPVRFPLSIPVTTYNISGELRVYEHGAELDKLRINGIGGGVGGWGGQQPPNTLLLSRSGPDWRLFDQAVSNSVIGAAGQTVPHVQLVPDKAPTRWIDYSMLDLVLLPLKELDQMPAASRDALVVWTLAGGNLVVHGVADDRDRALLDRLLDLPHRPPTRATWRQPRAEDRRVVVPGTNVPGYLNSQSWHTEAVSRLDRQGIEAYRAYCRDILNTYGNVVNSANDLNGLAWTCVLGPDAVPDMARVVQMAERAVGANRSWEFLNTLGVALYRAGRLEESVKRLQEAEALHGRGGGPQDWFFLAMAHKRLGNADGAKQWLDKALRASDVVADRNVELRVFRKEAEELFRDADKAEAADPKKAAPADQPAGAQPTAPAPNGAIAQAAPQAGQAKPAAEADFAIRAFGMGQLARMAKADPFPGTEEDWTWLLATVGRGRLKWTDRHGMSARGGNSDFWNFLIPGVGQAPVGAFQVMITIFAVLIGPLNYAVLRRRKQLYFLIVTVPSVALLTTGLLLGYVIASEGFGVRTRVRSVTLLDQVRGESVSWSRISYYAGLAPAGGLRFSTDTAVYPIEPDVSESATRTVDWTDDQRLASGWLRSRTPTQLLTVGYRQTGEQLVVSKTPDGGMRATNNLGAAIQLLVVCDDAGTIYTAKNVAPAARATLEPVEIAESATELREIVAAQTLQAPVDFIPTRPSGPSYGLFGMFRGYRWNQSVGASTSSSLLEEALRPLRGPPASQGPPDKLLSPTDPRTYLAIVDQPSLIELGVRDTTDAGSLYVIYGTY